MSAVAPRSRSLERDHRPRMLEGLGARRLSYPGGPSLDERIASTWSSLVEGGSAECPVCAAELRAAQACRGCGSELT